MTLLIHTSLGQFNTAAFDNYLFHFPESLSAQLLKFRRPEDRYASLLGKLMLLEGLQLLGYTNVGLGDLHYSTFKRPYFNLPVDFNISHSGSLVVCILSTCQRVGIDVEEILPVEIDDFKDQFSVPEWKEIKQVSHNYNVFYNFWTRKEALLKANGMGLALPLSNICVYNETAQLEGERWWLKKVDLAAGYVSNIAVSRKTDHLHIIEKSF